MLQKRYESYGPKGKAWTKWFDLMGSKDADLPKLQKEEKWQVKDKLRNEFRIKPKEESTYSQS